VVVAAGVFGGGAAYVGAALSASAPALPTGPIIVLVAFALFLVSLLLAPGRGVLASALRRWRFRRLVHRRQGLLALAHGEPIHEPFTLSVLRREGLIRPDGVATEAGRAQAARALRDERRWQVARQMHHDEAVVSRYDGLTPIEEVLAGDEIAEIDARIGGPAPVPAGG
jgi:manganese/zinc/iron transport system permease protein